MYKVFFIFVFFPSMALAQNLVFKNQIRISDRIDFDSTGDIKDLAFSHVDEQGLQKRVTIEILAATNTNSNRFFNSNENDHFYFELRGGYRINKIFETNIFVGYKLKSFIYFAERNGNQVPLFMDRHYVPAGVNGRIYFSDFIYEKMKLWKIPDRWDVYNQVGLIILKGRDVSDSREEEFRSQGYTVPFYLYPYVRRYNKIYLSYLFGVRYNFSKNFGLFLEGGQGALNDLQIGIAGKF